MGAIQNGLVERVWLWLARTGPARRGAATAALCLALAACAPAPPNPALWRITDSDSEITLLGTVHILPPDLKWRTARIDSAFEAADTIVFETDIASPDAVAELQRLFLERGIDRSGETLSMQLTPEDRARLARIAPRLGLSPAALEPTRPWFAAIQLQSLYVLSQGQSADAGVETVLEGEARAAGKRTSYLETPDQHIATLADLTPEGELALLVSTLREIDEGDAGIAAMDSAWVRGDTTALGAMLDDSIDEAGPEVHAALLTTRNTRWTAQIETMLAGRGRIFIAVGAAHLIGPNSVIAQLRARGHIVDGP